MTDRLYLNSICDSLGLRGIAFEELEEPVASVPASLYKLWCTKSQHDGLPLRSEFRPSEMKRELPYIYMVDRVDDGADYQIRLMGTALVELLGADFTGVKMGDLGENDGWRSEVYKLVFARAKPCFFRFELGSGNRRVITENTLLPARDSAGEFSMLICASQVVDQRYLDIS